MKRAISLLLVFSMILSFAAVVSAKTMKIGDIDGNEKISASDARKVLRVAAKLDTCDAETFMVADVDQNSKITASDARKILRVAAKLDSEFGDITVGEDVERTEVSDAIGMTMSNYISKFDNLTSVGTSDGTLMYSSAEIIIVSDPKMIDDGKISSVSVIGGSYMINGVYTFMTADDAKSILTESGWSVKSESDSLAVFSKDSVLMNVSLYENSVVKIELCLAFSIATNVPSSDESANGDDSTETTTQAPSDTAIAFEDLPLDAQYFLSGEFGITGSISNEGGTNPVSMYTDLSNVSMSTSSDIDGSEVDITILILDEGNTNKNVYILNNVSQKYCEITDTTIAVLNGLTGVSFDIDFSAFEIDLSAGDADSLTITSETKTVDSVEYTVYMAQGDSGVTHLYFIGDEIQKVISYDLYGNALSTVEIEELLYPIPDDCFSYDSYTNTTSILEVFEDYLSE